MLDMNISKENELGVCQRCKLFFVVSWCFMPYFHLTPFVNKKQFREDEISQVVVFVHLFVFNFAIALSPLKVGLS